MVSKKKPDSKLAREEGSTNGGTTKSIEHRKALTAKHGLAVSMLLQQLRFNDKTFTRSYRQPFD